MISLADGSGVPLVDRHDAVLLDLDGVLYVGSRAVDGAPEALSAVRERSLAVAFVTNNASRSPGTVAGHLTELGIPADENEVVTSAQAAAGMVARLVPAGAAVLVVGGAGLEEALRDRGLRPVRSCSEGPAVVVQGFAPEVGWRALAEGTFAVRSGLPWVATNLDLTVPTEGGLAPGNGTLVGVIAQATGSRPVSAGKPEPPLYDEALARSVALRPLAVGDRLDTDIAGANRAGIPVLLVLTGVTTADDLVRARVGERPSYVAADLREGLLRPHPGVRRSGEGWRCRGWTCTVTPDDIVVQGDGDLVDGLRALCVAAWSFADEGGTTVDDSRLHLALRRLGW